MTSRLYADDLATANIMPAIDGYLDAPQVSLEEAVEPVVDIIPNIIFHAQYAKRQCSHPLDALTPDESGCIYLYTMENVGLYKKLNEAIQDKRRHALKRWFRYLKLFHVSLNKLPSSQESVWRGINQDITQDKSEQLEIGKTLTLWRVTSCTLNIKVAQSFMQEKGHNTLLMINCKNGKCIHNHSSYPSEKELILLPGTRLKVVGDPFQLPGIHIIHLKEMARYEELIKLPPITGRKIKSQKLTNNTLYDHQSTFPVKPKTPKLTSLHENATLSTNSTPRINSSSFKGIKSDSVALNVSIDSKSTTKFSNGDIYEGQTMNGKKQGEGTYKWANGGEYTGEWNEDNFHGQGSRIWASGDTYIGRWADGKKQGHGTYTWQNGSHYEGDWKDDKRMGRGVWKSKDGYQYNGEFLDGERHGKGTYTWSDGSTYTGHWKNGNMEGKGTRRYSNGNVYNGYWVNDKKHGNGTLTWISGDKYEGQYQNDMKHGHGSYTWPNGNKYSGDWKEDQRTGQGTFVWVDGERYEGSWVKGKRHGKGKFVFASGGHYVGDWNDDKRTGKGV
ncbi:unnamed protein product [Rotaria socialis]|uniref:NAD(P)(+)--arginine ADP-ribosyltransferase n=1 Tax=Rotaria socialis TaxID=392032 RepID=A0A818UP28_9BILA|nr:unnamed protein product [Rotaria socialis]